MSLATMKSTRFLSSFSRPRAAGSPLSAAKPTRTGCVAGTARTPEAGKNIRRRHEPKVQRRVGPFQFACRPAIGRVIRDGGGHDDDVGAGGLLLHGGLHLVCAADGDHSTPAGGVCCDGPDTSTTRAPRRAASAATAYPILPLDRLPMNRTASMSS